MSTVDTEPLQEQQSPGCFGIIFSAIGSLIGWTIAYAIFTAVGWMIHSEVRIPHLPVWTHGAPSEALVFFVMLMFAFGFIPLTIVLGVIGDSSRIASGVAIFVFFVVGTAFQSVVWVWTDNERVAVVMGMNTLFAIGLWLIRAQLQTLTKRRGESTLTPNCLSGRTASLCPSRLVWPSRRWRFCHGGWRWPAWLR